jgi:hypothetical protein
MNRDEEITQLSRTFRESYVASTPAWYHGAMHLAFTLCFTGGIAIYSWLQLHQVTVWEWLVIAPMFLFGNWAEWAGHRYLLHDPKSAIKMAYKRHVGVHHVFFSHRTLEYNGHKEWRALLFPPLAPVLFMLSALPAALVLGLMWSSNAAYVVMLTMGAYFLMYEGLHTLSHLPDVHFLDKIPVINTVRRMHILHHNMDYMHTHNFNLTFPICDALFGTSDLQKGVIGTLFNGTSNDAMKPEVREALAKQCARSES